LLHIGEGRRLDADLVEQVLFALVANRCLEPGSKLAATHWARERVALVGCPCFDDDAPYAAMDFLLDALGEIARGIFDKTANLLNLCCDVIFVDTSSTYFERDVPRLLGRARHGRGREGGEETGRRRQGSGRGCDTPLLQTLEGPPSGPPPSRARHGRHHRGDPDPLLEFPRDDV
jgi:hypothetical protein